MSKVKVVDKKVSMGLSQLIKYQIMTYCFIEKFQLSEADLNCLTLLGAKGHSDITDFCNLAAVEHVFKTPQTVRNCIVKLEKMKLVTRDLSKKVISLSPAMQIQTLGNIVLDYKLYHLDTKTS